jgi:hypothetical protein
VGFTIGSRGKVPGKTCEKKIINNNNNNNNNHQPLRITPSDLFQSRIASETMNPYRRLVGLLGRVISPL